jgi:hypothetical protein
MALIQDEMGEREGGADKACVIRQPAVDPGADACRAWQSRDRNVRVIGAMFGVEARPVARLVDLAVERRQRLVRCNANP